MPSFRTAFFATVTQGARPRCCVRAHLPRVRNEQTQQQAISGGDEAAASLSLSRAGLVWSVPFSRAGAAWQRRAAWREWLRCAVALRRRPLLLGAGGAAGTNTPLSVTALDVSALPFYLTSRVVDARGRIPLS